MFCCVEQNKSEFISKRSQKYQNSDFVLFCFLSLKMAWAECNVWNFKRNRNQVRWVLSTVQVLSALARRGPRYGYTRNVGTFGHHGGCSRREGEAEINWRSRQESWGRMKPGLWATLQLEFPNQPLKWLSPLSEDTVWLYKSRHDLNLFCYF